MMRRMAHVCICITLATIAEGFVAPVSRGSLAVAVARSPSYNPICVSTADLELADEEVADRIIMIRPKALDHLLELRETQGANKDILLRMGVRTGGCSGLSYVMDLVKQEDVTADDMIEEYDGFKCIIDPKSALYLYGLELDFSDALVGGGFQFQNPNAESSCGCGKSFGV